MKKDADPLCMTRLICYDTGSFSLKKIIQAIKHYQTIPLQWGLPLPAERNSISDIASPCLNRSMKDLSQQAFYQCLQLSTNIHICKKHSMHLATTYEPIMLNKVLHKQSSVFWWYCVTLSLIPHLKLPPYLFKML